MAATYVKGEIFKEMAAKARADLTPAQEQLRDAMRTGVVPAELFDRAYPGIREAQQRINDAFLESFPQPHVESPLAYLIRKAAPDLDATLNRIAEQVREKFRPLNELVTQLAPAFDALATPEGQRIADEFFAALKSEMQAQFEAQELVDPDDLAEWLTDEPDRDALWEDWQSLPTSMQAAVMFRLALVWTFVYLATKNVATLVAAAQALDSLNDKLTEAAKHLEDAQVAA